jgi:hypothetical protein
VRWLTGRSGALARPDLHDATALYRSSGYGPIERYGRYRDEPRCLCFEKVLATS